MREVVSPSQGKGLSKMRPPPPLSQHASPLNVVRTHPTHQVSLATRYGTVLLYDDTAARKQYRLPLGLGIVIDGDFYTRVIFQATTADSTSETLQWLLEVFVEARGAAPDVFIQAPDVALDAAAQKVFPFAIKRRCIWHLMQIVKKDLGEVLGDTFPVSVEVVLNLNLGTRVFFVWTYYKGIIFFKRYKQTLGCAPTID